MLLLEPDHILLMLACFCTFVFLCSISILVYCKFYANAAWIALCTAFIVASPLSDWIDSSNDGLTNCVISITPDLCKLSFAGVWGVYLYLLTIVFPSSELGAIVERSTYIRRLYASRPQIMAPSTKYILLRTMGQFWLVLYLSLSTYRVGVQVNVHFWVLLLPVFAAATLQELQSPDANQPTTIHRWIWVLVLLSLAFFEIGNMVGVYKGLQASIPELNSVFYFELAFLPLLVAMYTGTHCFRMHIQGYRPVQ